MYPQLKPITGTTSELSKDLDQARYEQLKAQEDRERIASLPKCEKCSRPFKPPYNFPAAKLCFDCKPVKPFIKHEARREGWTRNG